MLLFCYFSHLHKSHNSPMQLFHLAKFRSAGCNASHCSKKVLGGLGSYWQTFPMGVKSGVCTLYCSLPATSTIPLQYPTFSMVCNCHPYQTSYYFLPILFVLQQWGSPDCIWIWGPHWSWQCCWGHYWPGVVTFFKKKSYYVSVSLFFLGCRSWCGGDIDNGEGLGEGSNGG